MLLSRLVTTALLATTALTALPVYAQTETPPATEEVVDEEAAPEEDVDVSAPGAGGFQDEIVVQGRYIPEPVRNTAQVVSVLSAEEISRAGDGDIAGALARVTGLSVSNSGFVFVRGLGDRYSLALLNGLSLPSPEPLRRVIPLDLFPTSVVSSAVVQKSYSVNYPGEFGGGVINLTTPSIPDENFLTLGVGISGDSETTAKFGYSYYGSGRDIIGYDGGTRSLNGPLGDILNANTPINLNNYDRDELSAIAATVPIARTAQLQGNYDIPANFSADLSAGYSTYAGDTRLGVVANASFSNAWKTRDAIQQVADGPQFQTNERSVRTENRIVANGLLGFGVEFDDDNKIRFTNVYIHDTSKLAGRSGRFDFQTGGSVLDREPRAEFDFLDTSTSFVERQLINSQLVGEFRIDDFTIAARAGYANSQRESPFEWSYTYIYNPADNSYTNDLRARSPSISFSDLNEDVYNGAIDFGYELPTDINIILSAGYAYTDTSRDVISRTLEFRDSGIPLTAETLLNFDVLPIELLLSPGSINFNEIFLNETTIDPLGIQYLGDLTVHGGYLKADVEITEGLRLDIGVRYEDADQSVTLVDYFGTAGGDIVQNIGESYWLPAATLTWNFAENFQARLHGSKTIARPQFRELAPIPYSDVESDRRFTGNPFLVDSELTNFEARLEYYPARGERISVAGFYKDITNPIETVGTVDQNSLSATFANAPSAELYGAEFEVVKYFPLDTLSDADFFLNKQLVLSANYTYSKSSIQASADAQTIIYRPVNIPLLFPSDQVFVDGSPITGQSEHLANLQFGIEDTEALQQITMLLSYASERVSNRGPRNSAGGIDPDIIEKPGISLDVVLRQGFDIWGQDFEMKFEARNITGTDFRETQEGDGYTVFNNVYDVGTRFSASISAKF